MAIFLPYQKETYFYQLVIQFITIWRYTKNTFRFENQYT